MDHALSDIQSRPVRQQPEWQDRSLLERVRTLLGTRPGLVSAAEIRTLRGLLAEVAEGRAQVMQCGDCAEDPAESTVGDVARKTALLDLLAGTMKMNTHKPVVRAGRIAGQFAKPRSQPTERVGGVDLPVYRGHMANSPEPDPEGRRPDPTRMLLCYRSAYDIMKRLGWGDPAGYHRFDPPVWTSHEALVLDYEIPLVRRDEQGQLVLTSTHWPWIGARTHQVDGAHVALLSRVINPVACKIGPDVDADELLALCERLDPEREKGRLTLIARMGAGKLTERLSPLVAAVSAAGHPVVWLSDPMHGNTVIAADGLKTRYLETIEQEIQDFLCVVRAHGGVAGGLHLETTPDSVSECVSNESWIDDNGRKYTSLCDPRLNPRQAVSVVSGWRG